MNKLAIPILLLTLVGLFEACQTPQETTGMVKSHVIPSKVLGKEVNYQIYLPKDYQDTALAFPIVYLLHGHGGNEEDWFQTEEGNVQFLLDSLTRLKKIPQVIAVTVDAGNSWYVNRVAQMESFYLNEFMPYVESQYRVDLQKPRTIAGNSAGGYGALRFSVLHPSLFQNVILLSPASYEPLPPAISSSRKVEAFALNGTFNDSIWNQFSYTHIWDTLKRTPKRPKFYLSVGDDDIYNIVPVVARLQQQMLADSIPNELRITDGGHDWTCWQKNVSEALVDIFAMH